MFGSDKIDRWTFKNAMKSLDYQLGFQWNGMLNIFEDDPAPYSWSLVSKIKRAEERAEAAERRANELAAVLDLVLDELGLELVVAGKKELRKKKPMKGGRK